MSRIGNPDDNAKAESCMKMLKAEGVNGAAYRDLEHVRGAMGGFIEAVYNLDRLHSALAYQTQQVGNPICAPFLVSE